MVTKKELLKDRFINTMRSDFDDMLERWFVIRFNKLPKYDEVYFETWQRRFKDGRAWMLMDLQSRRDWLRVEKIFKSKRKQ